MFVARTGYTGEDGYELILPAEPAQKAWEALVAAGVQPCGLGARDSLRLEAGMHLYGHDMDESLSPLECGLAWTVSFTDDRDFVGKAALEKQKTEGVTQKLTGLVLEGRGVLREGQVVVGDAGEGVITSGTFSPTLERSIALARVPKAQTGNAVVQVRKKELPVRLVKPGFVRNGKPVDGILD